jgi:hypothetical protein
MLNSLNCLTSALHIYFLREQIVFQLIQEVFLISSLFPQKNVSKRDSIEEIIHEGALKKEKV